MVGAERGWNADRPPRFPRNRRCAFQAPECGSLFLFCDLPVSTGQPRAAKRYGDGGGDRSLRIYPCGKAGGGPALDHNRRRTTAGRAPARLACPGQLEAATKAAHNHHDTLFWHLRHWAYRQPRGQSLRIWSLRVRAEALAMLAMMPARRLRLSEVEWTARGVASWVWSRPPLDTSWRAQFFRGVKREHGKVSRETVAALWTRNRAIVGAVQGGRSRRAVGRKLALHHETVRQVLVASETWLSPDAEARDVGRNLGAAQSAFRGWR